MKSKLTNLIPAAVVLAVIAALTMAATGVARAADHKTVANPNTGSPAPPMFDPTTGLPSAPPAPPPWKDPNWKDPDKVLPEVVYQGLPLSEVAIQLRAEFKDLDVLIPGGLGDQSRPGETLDPGAILIKMQLKNVTASEVFNAMNMVFEGENTPVRWELRLNGRRPTAILRMVPQRLPDAANPPPPPTRRVYFVGDLIGDEKSGGMRMVELVKTVSEVYQMSYGESKGVLQFHNEAQLLIVTGTNEQDDLIKQTLYALREKARVEHKPEPKPAEPKARTEETKTR